MKRYHKICVIVIITVLVSIVMPCSTALAGPDDVVVIPDSGLRDAIAAEIGPPPFTESALSSIIDLDASYYGISNLAGLEYCTNLAYLYLRGNDFSNITVLSGLTNLKELDLSGNNVFDISVLYALTNLQGLDLSVNDITDISVLSSLTSLVYLDLSGNDVSDISALSGLTDLMFLILTSNEISDISSLLDLTALYELGLSGNDISDITALSGHLNLRKLGIGNNNVSDISPLAGLQYLQNLDLINNAISDISVLSGLASIRNLYLGSNNISNIEPLVNNSGLGFGDFVDLLDNPLDDVSVLIFIPQLEDRWVTVYYNMPADNHPPDADASGPYVAAEGDILTLDGSGSSDPDDNIDLYEWDLDNDGQYSDASGETVSVVFDDNGVFPIGLKVTDSNGETDTDNTTVTIVNQPPLIAVDSDVSVYLGDVFTFTVTFSDPGILDTHNAEIDWGDGNIDPQTVDEVNGSGSFSDSHVYAWPGTYQVTVTVSDNDLGEDSATVSVEVLPVADVMIETIADVIEDMDLSEGKNESIGASLDAAVKALEDSNPKNDGVAVNTLEAFINKIEAWRGKKISEEDADALIAWALETIAALSDGA